MGRQHIVEGIEHIGDAQFLDVGEGYGEILPEIAQHFFPVDLAVGDAVELLFQVGGEIIFDIAPEEAFEERGDDAALVFRDQAFLFQPHIAAVAQGGKNRHIGRRPSDAELFELLDDRGFRIARRRLGEMLGRFDFPHADLVGPRHGRQAPGVLVFLVVEIFMIDLEEAVEFHHRAVGAEGVMLAVEARGAKIGGGALHLGTFHLAGDGALPDEIVERQLLAIERLAHRSRMARQLGRPDRLVGFLGVLGLRRVTARHRGQIGFAEILENGIARGGDGFARHVDAIGAHIGDEAHGLAADVDALIEALGDLHGLRG